MAVANRKRLRTASGSWVRVPSGFAASSPRCLFGCGGRISAQERWPDCRMVRAMPSIRPGPVSARTINSAAAASWSQSSAVRSRSSTRPATASPNRTAARRRSRARSCATPSKRPLRHAFPAPLLAPLLGPLRHPFCQSHRRFLQGCAGCPVRLPRLHASSQLIHPLRKHRAETRVCRRPQPTDQRDGHLQEILRRLALLEAGHPAHQVARRQIVHRDVPLVKQQRVLRRLAGRQHRGHRRHGGDQVAHLERGGPRRVAVVEHHRHDRRPVPGRPEFPAAVEPLVEQRRVLHVAQRHVGVDGGLELQHDEEMERAVAEAHAPRGVPAAGLAQIADVLGRQLLERAEVDVVDPVRADRAQQVARSRSRTMSGKPKSRL